MSFTISLHAEPKMTHNVKYRTNFSAPALYTTTAVNNGNFSNKNLYVDNSVELAMGRKDPDEGTYQLATNCNYIKIQWDGKVVIGLITDWQYINDSNVNISYSVDAFMSAIESGFIEEINGICERVNLTPSGAFVNLQSEPFSPSDNMLANTELTTSLNTELADFEGFSPSGSGVTNADTRIVVTVSSAIVEYLGVSAWDVNPVVGTPVLKNINTLKFIHGDTTLHSGGVYKGTPLVFTLNALALGFLNDILSGCGFRTVMGSNGWSTQNAVAYRQYITDANTGGGQANNYDRNNAGDPMEAIRFITNDDIYNMYCLPAKFCVPQNSYFQSFGIITGFKSLANLHRFGAEDAPKSKLLAHPYNYNKVVTANGDTVNIIPQTHWLQFDTINDGEPFVWLRLRYIGGDTPRIMGMFDLRDNESGGSYDNNKCVEWFTIRSYPAVTLSINDSFNPQLQRDVQNTRQISAVYANSRADARLSNPFRQGYLDYVNGETSIPTNNSAWDNILGGLGVAVGAVTNPLAPINPNSGLGLFEDKNAQAADNARTTAEAGNIISSAQTSIMGNDFMSQYGVPAFAAYNQGATDAEFFTFSRFLEEFGAACNCYLNPLTNAGDLFGGNATVTPINGRTFYQYSNITIEGVMPIYWKDNIKTLFESGVYLLD